MDARAVHSNEHYLAYHGLNLVMQDIEKVWLKQMNCLKPLQKFFSSNDVVSVVHFSQMYISCFNCCKLDYMFTSSLKHNKHKRCGADV